MSGQDSLSDYKIEQMQKSLDEHKNDSRRREDKTQEKLDGIEDTLRQVLQFMAAQEEKNEAAQKERDRIFKASTLLPVAILTSLVSVGVNMMIKSTPPQTNPPQQAYIIPQRGDTKQAPDIKLRKD